MTLEDVIRLVARFRALGIKVINAQGEDLCPAEIEAIFNEAISC
jgi:hypothetical protein